MPAGWTARARFLETVRLGRPDRPPYLEEGLREGVLEAWRAQGMAPDEDLEKRFRLDRRETVPLRIEPSPSVRRWPRTDRGMSAQRRRLDVDDPSRLPADWPRRVRAWRHRRHILQLPVHRGFFLSMGVGGWRRFAEVLCLLHDAPTLVRRTMALHAEMCGALADRVLAEVKVDMVSFSEPIAGADGPLLSPRQYKQFVLDSYRPILDVLLRRGVETICYVTYANPRPLLRAVMEAGFNCLWACEAHPQAMDYRAIRREFGRDLRLIGGIDLDVLMQGERAIRREILAKVPPLLEQGGYVPVADGRVRPNMTYANYCRYRYWLERAIEGADGARLQ